MTLTWILETTLRTVCVAGLAGLCLTVFRVRSATVKLAVWRLVLFASLLMPLVGLLPRRTVVVRRPANPAVSRVVSQFRTSTRIPRRTSTPIDWRTMALRGYALVAGLRALRTVLGLMRLRQLSAGARPLAELGPEVFETRDVAVPVTYGVWQPRVLLPVDWRNWPNETLRAILAHERSHIAERDFLTQCLAKVNRALYWANPLAWWLERELAQLAEQVSDDAALARVAERPTYAAMLLHFAARRANLAAYAGVAMARPGGVSSRIERILDEAHDPSRPVPGSVRFGLALAVFFLAIVVGTARLATVSAQGAKESSSGGRWALMYGGRSIDGGAGAWERAKARADLARGGDYLWFMRNGKQYLIDDPKVLAEIEAWFQPLEELAREQGEFGAKQGALGEEISKVIVEIPEMGKLRAQIAELSKLRTPVGAEDLAELQSHVGELQALIGQAQLGEQQGKIAAEAERKLQRLVEEMMREGRAREVR